jgi:hypothetical protein
MIDIIQLTTTATYNEKAELWVADIKGYPVTGKGESPEEAIMDARDEMQKFFLAVAGRRYVSVIHAPVSLKADITVRIESDRGATLAEFGIGAGREEEQEADK